MAVSEFPPHPEPRRRSHFATFFNRLRTFCGALFYALVALALRFIIARVFFLSGQMKIAGPSFATPLVVAEEQFAITLPAEIRPATFDLFATQYAALPMSPTFAAYLFSYAEFVLPICLALGFATRLSALALLIMTALIQVYVAPEALWTAHVYLLAILLVLISVGPGAISLDALIRAVSRK